MIVVFFNKILITLFVMSCLNIIRHIYFLVQTFFLSEEEGQGPIKYKVSKHGLWVLAVSISYLITCIITSITIH